MTRRSLYLLFSALFLLLVFSCAPASQATPAGFTIAGTVIDSVTAQPLSNAEVSLTLSTDSEHSLSFTTSPDGRFSFSNLPLGKFQLSATRRGYTSQSLDQHGNFSTSVIVGPGLDTEHLRFRLAPGAILTGAVTDDSGEPIRGAGVLLLRQDLFSGSRKFQPVNRVTTNDLGRYRFAHLQPGAYSVAVIAQPWFTASGDPEKTVRLKSSSSTTQPIFDVVYPITYYSNANSISDATKLTLVPGAIQSADFSLHAVPSVHLFVQFPYVPVASDENSDGNTNARIDSARAGPSIGIEYNITGNTTPGDAFSETFEPTPTEVSPGLIELSGLRPGAAFVETSPSPTGRTSEAPTNLILQSVQLGPSSQINLSATGSSADVRGSIIVDNAPVEKSSNPKLKAFQLDVLILKSTQTGSYLATEIGPQGEFSLSSSPVASGVYEFTVSDGDKFLITSIAANNTKTSGNVVTISTGQPTRLTIHASQADCAIKGYALKNGKPLAGAMLVLVPQDSSQHAETFHRDQSDSDGSFTLSPIFPGKYTLLALENGWDLEWANPAVLFKYLPQGLPVTLTPAASLTLNPQVQ